MYAQENKQYYPVAKTKANYRISFQSVPNFDYNGLQYWPSFLAKYVSRAKQGNAAGTGTTSDAINSRERNIFWGCPAFNGYSSTNLGGTALVQTGYGMNAFPEYTSTFPPPANPGNTLGDLIFPNDICVVNMSTNWGTLSEGKWYKQKAWSTSSERALVADTRFWLLEAQACPMRSPGAPATPAREGKPPMTSTAMASIRS